MDVSCSAGRKRHDETNMKGIMQTFMQLYVWRQAILGLCRVAFVGVSHSFKPCPIFLGTSDSVPGAGLAKCGDRRPPPPPHLFHLFRAREVEETQGKFRKVS